MREHRKRGGIYREGCVLIVGSLLSVAMLAGCGGAKTANTSGRADGGSATAAGSNSSPTGSGANAAEPGVAFRFADPQGLKTLIAQQKGKVVLVDFWATWCVPCVQGLPKNADLARRFSDKGLAVFTMAMDEKSEDETDAQFRKRLSAPLAAHAAAFSNLLSRQGGSEEAMEAFDIDGGALPHYRIYGRDGQLLKTFVSGDPDQIWEHADVEKAVTQALAN